MLKDAITRQLHPNYGEKRTQIAEFLFGVQVFGHAGPNMHETNFWALTMFLALYDPWPSKTRRNTRPTNWKISNQFDAKPANKNF